MTAKRCPCPVCTREGQHDAWCSVHDATYENMETPPCDCGLREHGRVIHKGPAAVFASIDPQEKPN
jgi:hypothetical protein